MFNCKGHELGLVLYGSEEFDDGNTLYIRGISVPDLEFVRHLGEMGD
jgi:ATP-dependent DNA helicase 2 subunit 2